MDSALHALAWIFVLAAGVGAAALARRLPFVSKSEADQSTNRFASIDGLRGYLALSVFVHHFAVHRNYLATDSWVAPRDRVLAAAGTVPVYTFFIITGFLFWNQAIRREASIDLRSLAISRFFRIAPLYVLATLIAFLLAWNLTGFRFVGDPGETYLAVTRLLSFGAFRIDTFNGADLMPFTAGVSWTLVHEWAFYAILPLIAWLARPRLFAILAATCLCGLAVYPRSELQFATLFLAGMASAHIVDALPSIDLRGNRWADATVLLLFTGAIAGGSLGVATLAVGFLFPAFLAVAFGADLFGLLGCAPSKLLGAASYSIYLLHGPILYIAFHLLLNPKWVSALSSSTAFGLELALVSAVCLVSIATYLMIERPMIRMGRRLAKRSQISS